MELKPVIDSLYAWGERWLVPRELIVNN
jgi:DNA-binding HxlR family transcriptional regulator